MATSLQFPRLDWRRWWRARPRRERRLRLVETLALGERRFVAVVSLDGREYLVGGTPSSLALLSELEDPAGLAGAP